MLKTQSWTPSAWKGEAALQHFVFENPRGQVMTAVENGEDRMVVLQLLDVPLSQFGAES